jgi:hypothetical protein
MRWLGALVFGGLTLLSAGAVWYFTLRAVSLGRSGGMLAIIATPALFLIFVGPFAALFLVFLVRAFRE